MEKLNADIVYSSLKKDQTLKALKKPLSIAEKIEVINLAILSGSQDWLNTITNTLAVYMYFKCVSGGFA